jgi:hypothetical protein|tara:strand:+ start:1317 stop:2261 length:945 start_codon:yes stop_codon:yes gene_type:complete
MKKIYNISDFDVIYISYDEPNAEKNWADLLSKCPWAKRVHGVKGFDAAHNAAGEASDTHRLVTVDGDNIVHAEFFNQTLEIDEDTQGDFVFSWCGHNVINSLAYGNGGLKLWPKHIIQNMNSHENSDDDAHAVDFCWMFTYFQMSDTFSDVVVTATPEQAYRAGFREGVKMSLDRGDLPPKSKFLEQNHIKNLQRLSVWCSVGFDVEYGDWAVLGAREAVCLTNIDEWDHTQIADYDFMQPFVNEQLALYPTQQDRLDRIKHLGERLHNELHFRVANLDAEASHWFKSVYQNPKRFGIMITEQEADRQKKKVTS